MALRVLLGDESGTIKKVFQLALQDFAVEVKPVNLGPDVLNVARNFKPDIIFADVLLQKRSGYEVCSDLKKDPELNKIPVVLMWSGFMELDHDKFAASKAEAHLEKPFDVNGLRSLIHQLVPRTKSQRLSNFLSFPNLPDFQESKAEKPTAAPDKGNWNMESFDPIEIPKSAETDDFKSVPLPPIPESTDQDHLPGDQAQMAPLLQGDGDEVPEWEQKDLSRFKLDLDAAEGELPVETHIPIQSASREPEQDLDLELSVAQASPLPDVPPPAPRVSAHEVEKIVRQEARQIIEEVAWKVIPELAEKILEREIKRLLDSKEL